MKFNISNCLGYFFVSEIWIPDCQNFESILIAEFQISNIHCAVVCPNMNVRNMDDDEFGFHMSITQPQGLKSRFLVCTG